MILLAQAAPPGSPLDWISPLSELGRTGLLGILLALALWAIIRLYKDLGAERNARLEDAKTVTELVKASTAATVAWTASQEERNRGLEATAAALRALQNIVERQHGGS